MKRSKFSETQIVTVLKEGEKGRLVADICREHGISNATYYQWKSKYGVMEASDLKRMKELVRLGEQSLHITSVSGSRSQKCLVLYYSQVRCDGSQSILILKAVPAIHFIARSKI